MKNVLFLHYRDIIKRYVDGDYADLVAIEPPKDESFGDFSTNISMILAKRLGRSPLEIAEEIYGKIKDHDDFLDLLVKKPGFINWKTPKRVLLEHFPYILQKDFGKTDMGNGIAMNIEYVSANPTGPLHAGHARGAVSGDVLANLLAFVGYNVTKEYYINDAGNQVEILAQSLYHRYLEILQKTSDKLPDWAYPGEYLIDTARKLADLHGNSFVDKKKSDWVESFKSFAVAEMMKNIKDDLNALGIHHDLFSSELDLVNNGAVEKVIEFLRSKNLIYRGVLDVPKGKEPEDWEEREQLLFKSTEFGDDVDRPLQKSDGSWTYFASDIAYHMDKINRGFGEMIDFFGADHGGYVKRMKAAVSALSGGTVNFDIKLSQIVRFIEDGREVKMSKRAGTFITVKDVIDSVGKDVVRFIMLTRRDDAPLNFDFKKVTEQSRDNPVFYVQYAYARTHSVLRQFALTFPEKSIPNDHKKVNLQLLDSESEMQLIKILCDWPRQVIMAAKNREPHRIAFYLSEVAAKFHSLWNQGKDNSALRFIITDDFDKTCARILLLKALQNVIESAFNIVGVTPVEELC